MLSSILTVSTHPLNRRGLALFFCLIKRTKNQVIWNASLHSRPLRCKASKTWAGGLLPTFVARAFASGNIPNSPAAAQPGIVLPAFARSRPADGATAHFCHGEIIFKSYNLQIKVKAIALAMAADTG